MSPPAVAITASCESALLFERIYKDALCDKIYFEPDPAQHTQNSGSLSQKCPLSESVPEPERARQERGAEAGRVIVKSAINTMGNV